MIDNLIITTAYGGHRHSPIVLATARQEEAQSISKYDSVRLSFYLDLTATRGKKTHIKPPDSADIAARACQQAWVSDANVLS